jgi:hypothetical protein
MVLPDTGDPHHLFTFKLSPTEATSLEEYNPEDTKGYNPSLHTPLNLQTKHHTYNLPAYHQLETNLEEPFNNQALSAPGG